MRPVKIAHGFDGRTRQPIHSFAAAVIVGVLLAAIAVATPILIQLAR